MVKNQTEFNKNHSKEKKQKQIKIREENNFQGSLVIEDYPELEKLYLRGVKSIEKVVLKDLKRLQEITIRDCGTKDLIIENCPQIKKLNVENNFLTNLGFIKDLKNLEELKINGNAELVEILEPYYNENDLDWKTYQKVIQGSNENIQELLGMIRDLKEEINRLKEKQPITIDNPVDFENKYQRLKGTLNYLLQQEEIKTGELNNLLEKEDSGKTKTNIVTKDLMEGLSNLKKTNQKLKKQVDSFNQLYLVKKQEVKQKEKELEELKKEYVKKTKFSFKAYSEKKIEEKTDELLKCQTAITKGNEEYISERKSAIKEKLAQKTKLTLEELNKICQLQIEITQLKLELQKKIRQNSK